MADMSQEEQKIEKQFRSKNLWHSFMQAAYGSLAAASFFGALMSISQGLIGTATTFAHSLGHGAKLLGTAADPSMGLQMARMSGFIVSNPVTLAALGGLIAVGLAFTYMSQREGTELKVLQDEHSAQQIELQRAKCKSLEQNIEFSQNQRADGKQWQEVVQAPAQAATQRLQ